MVQKVSKYVVIALLLISLTGFPIFVDAAEPNVNDWINNDGSNIQQENIEKDESDETNTNTSMVSVIGKLIFYTILIIVLIYALIKFLALRQKNLQPNQAIKLMGGTQLGNNKSLQLVKVGDQLLLLGVGDQITLLKEFLHEDEIKKIEENLATGQTNTISSYLKGKVNDRNTNRTTSFDNIFSQSLDKIKGKQDKFDQDLRNKNDKEGRL